MQRAVVQVRVEKCLNKHLLHLIGKKETNPPDVVQSIRAVYNQVPHYASWHHHGIVKADMAQRGLPHKLSLVQAEP